MKRILIKLLLPLAMLLCCLGFAACGTPDNLSAPENLRLEGGILLWDKVEYADGYAVYIDDEEYFTAECRYDASNLNEGEFHTLKVRAYTNGGIQSSYADMIYTGKYAIPTRGLEFKALESGGNLSYRVEKLAVDKNGWCIIPATYEGVPVTQLWSGGTPDSVLARIRSMYLPNCIQNFSGGGIYGFLPNLENIVLGEGNERFISDQNCLIEKATNTLVVGCINSRIPDYVTKIGLEAFRGRNLKEITVPDTITEIGFWAFLNCNSLKSVVLPKKIGMADSVFKNCPLEEVYYRGTEAEWEENESKIDNDNAILFSAMRYYYSETAPTNRGNYWRFVDGVPTKWA